MLRHRDPRSLILRPLGPRRRYRNEHIYNGTDIHGNPLRSRTERLIDPMEAAVVKRIFELYDLGTGPPLYREATNREDSKTQVPSKRKDGLEPVSCWAPSTIRSVLTRELCHGVSVWGKTKKKNAWGKLATHKRPESEWERTGVEHLRIIDELWRRVQSRRRDAEGNALRFTSGRISGRPPKYPVQNLLAGLARMWCDAFSLRGTSRHQTRRGHPGSQSLVTRRTACGVSICSGANRPSSTRTGCSS